MQLLKGITIALMLSQKQDVSLLWSELTYYLYIDLYRHSARLWDTQNKYVFVVYGANIIMSQLIVYLLQTELYTMAQHLLWNVFFIRRIVDYSLLCKRTGIILTSILLLLFGV